MGDRIETMYGFSERRMQIMASLAHDVLLGMEHHRQLNSFNDKGFEKAVIQAVDAAIGASGLPCSFDQGLLVKMIVAVVMRSTMIDLVSKE